MSTKRENKIGTIIRPLPEEFRVVENKLIFPDGDTYRHGEDFNATIISHFLLTVKPIAEDEEIVLNFNLLFYDAIKDNAERFTNPCVSGFRYLSEKQKQELYKYADESVRGAAIADNFLPQETDNGIDVIRRKGALAAVSSKEHERGSVVFQTTGVILPFPVRSTVEIPGDLHVRLTGGAEFMRHSCLPNLRLEVESDEIRGVALRPIEEGELLTFNYLCTEWEVTKVFQCSCNKYCCYGLIKGFKYLDREQQEHLLPNCCAAIREKFSSPLLHTASLSALNGTTSLSIQSGGKIVSQKHISAGTTLVQSTETPIIKGTELVLGGLRLPHSCDPNTVLIEGRLVTSRPLVSGDYLTFNFNTFAATLQEPFKCDCKSSHCAGDVKGFDFLSPQEKDRLWIFSSNEVRRHSLENGYQVQSSSHFVKIQSTPAIGQATFASKNIPNGKCVFHVTGLVIPFPTMYTIFIGAHKHLLFANGAQCLAHSCDPNTRIVVNPVNGSLDCFAIKDITEGELLSFNYLTTEWDMSEPFNCECGSTKCYKKIAGFAHLPEQDKVKLWAHATTAICSRFSTTATANSVLATLDQKVLSPCGPSGELQTCTDLVSGHVLFECSHFSIEGLKVLFGDVFVKHSCDASAAYLNGRLVMIKAVPANTKVTVNINQLSYALESSLKCNCGSEYCAHQIGGFGQLSADAQNRVILCTAPNVRDEACKNGYKNRSSSPFVDVRANGEMGQATFAASHIKKDTRFFRVGGIVLPFPTVYTIMIENGKHLLFADGAQCLAHSCDPNVRIIIDPESRTLDCLALRDIKEGELISFNYLTTEYNMDCPFKCVCGSPNCYGKIAGFKHLSISQRQELWSMCTPAIKNQTETTANWKRLSSSDLSTDNKGHVLAVRNISEGTPVLSASRTELRGDCVLVDGITLRHSCAPTAAIIEFRVVTTRTVCAGVELTIDLNCLAYEFTPFKCNCGVAPAPHPVSGFAHLTPEVQAERVIFTDAVVRAQALQNGFKVPCSSSLVTVKANGEMGQATFAASTIAAGTRFLRVKGLCLPFPTLYTILLSEDRHLLFAEGAQCLAHSCNPNVQICIDAVNNTLECEALRDISEDELISFNYNCTEWDMNTPFRCLCGASSCVFDIRGYKHLTQRQRESIMSQTTPAIRELAGLYADVHLPPHLKADTKGFVVASEAIANESVVMELFYLDVQPQQLGVGRDYAVAHSNESNCVLVEGRLISCMNIEPGTQLTVNLNYFVYDMTALFPRSYSEDCKGFRYMDEMFKQKYLYLCEPPVRAQAMRDGWTVKSSQTALVVRPNGDMGQTAYATRDIQSGEKLFHCTGLAVPFPTMYTICVGHGKHLLFGDAAECIAHHCDPNVEVVVNGDGTFDFAAIKDIKEGEMVTFNYATTEWDMNTPFLCLCGSQYCAGTMQGFKHLSNKDRQRLWSITSPVIKDLCAIPSSSPLKK